MTGYIGIKQGLEGGWHVPAQHVIGDLSTARIAFGGDKSFFIVPVELPDPLDYEANERARQVTEELGALLR